MQDQAIVEVRSAGEPLDAYDPPALAGWKRIAGRQRLAEGRPERVCPFRPFSSGPTAGAYSATLWPTRPCRRSGPILRGLEPAAPTHGNARFVQSLQPVLDQAGIGIDFGTTNSVVAVADRNGAVRSAVWPSAGGLVDVFRTALFFWSEGRAPGAEIRHAAGPEALDKALAGTGEGRFIQSIKTYLGSSSFRETRLFARRFTIEDLVATFLQHLAADGPVDPRRLQGAIVSGRPVIFAGERPDEALALERLQSAYGQAGFGAVEFAYEPLGAAYWYARDLRRDETVLVADFGGGTSDFSVIRFTRTPKGLDAEPLGHSGVGVAGDTFDYRLIDNLVAPQLGKGLLYRSFDKRLPFPAYVHAAFAQWHQLSWLKTPQTMRELRTLAAASEAPDAIEKLIAFLDFDLGFELYQAIARVKAELSEKNSAELSFASHGVALGGRVTRAQFEGFIAGDLRRMAGAMDEALASAQVKASDIGAVFLTGGTSFVPAVRHIFVERFGPERVHAGNAFQSVASGLALIAADRAPRGVGQQDREAMPGRHLAKAGAARLG